MWLGRVRFEQPLVDAVLGEYLGHHEVLLARRDRLEALIAEQAAPGPMGADRRSLALPARGRHA